MSAQIPLQDKIAELERRIAALEQRATTTTTQRVTIRHIDLEPEMSGIFAHMNALFAKVFK